MDPLGESKKALLGGVDSSRLRGFHIWSRSKRVPPILSSFFGTGSRVDSVRALCARCACVTNHIIAKLLYIQRAHSNVCSKAIARARVSKEAGGEKFSQELGTSNSGADGFDATATNSDDKVVEHNETINVNLLTIS